MSAELILILIHLSSRVVLISFVMFRDLIKRNQYVTYLVNVYIDLYLLLINNINYILYYKLLFRYINCRILYSGLIENPFKEVVIFLLTNKILRKLQLSPLRNVLAIATIEP